MDFIQRGTFTISHNIIILIYKIDTAIIRNPYPYRVNMCHSVAIKVNIVIHFKHMPKLSNKYSINH